MCGRFALRLAHDEIRRIPGHEIDVVDWLDEEAFVPRYNIAPRSQAPVLRHRTIPTDSNEDGTNSSYPLHHTASAACDTQQGKSTHYILQTMKWGLVPHWSKFEDKTLSTTNARSENLIESGGMWASIKGKKRCAVICQGYYEWLTRGKEKLPHFTKHRNGQVMLLAGLYDCAFINETPLWSFTIVTTRANKEFAWLHDRQPVILSTSAALDTWLNTSSHVWTTDTSRLVQPYSDTEHPLECYQVPKEVGKVGSESPMFIQPIANRKDGIQAMFAQQAIKRNMDTSNATRAKRLRSPLPAEGRALATPVASKTEQKAGNVDGGSKRKATPEFLASPIKSPPTKRRLSPKKNKGLDSDSSNTKLTSFFPKV